MVTVGSLVAICRNYDLFGRLAQHYEYFCKGAIYSTFAKVLIMSSSVPGGYHLVIIELGALSGTYLHRLLMDARFDDF